MSQRKKKATREHSLKAFWNIRQDMAHKLEPDIQKGNCVSVAPTLLVNDEELLNSRKCSVIMTLASAQAQKNTNTHVHTQTHTCSVHDVLNIFKAS